MGAALYVVVVGREHALEVALSITRHCHQVLVTWKTVYILVYLLNAALCQRNLCL